MDGCRRWGWLKTDADGELSVPLYPADKRGLRLSKLKDTLHHTDGTHTDTIIKLRELYAFLVDYTRKTIKEVFR